jgi:DNA-binding beta-propeller fold protein YncE
MRLRLTAISIAADVLLAAAAFAQVPGFSGTLVVTNKTPATATIIDVATGRALATLPTGNGPHELVLSANGRTAVVTDYGSGSTPTLTVIDVPAKRVVRTISLGQYTRPHGIGETRCGTEAGPCDPRVGYLTPSNCSDCRLVEGS